MNNSTTVHYKGLLPFLRKCQSFGPSAAVDGDTETSIKLFLDLIPCLLCLMALVVARVLLSPSPPTSCRQDFAVAGTGANVKRI